jgi:rubrerythrin
MAGTPEVRVRRALLTATKDAEHSQAALLAEQLRAAAANRDHSGHGGYDEVPGDPACWLHRVCPACGNLAPVEPPTVCPQCGTAIATV